MTDTDLFWREARITADEAKYNARIELLTDLKKIRHEAVSRNSSPDFIAGIGAAIDAVRTRLNHL